MSSLAKPSILEKLRAAFDDVMRFFGNPVVFWALAAVAAVSGVVIFWIVILGIVRLIVHWFWSTLEDILEATIGKIIPGKHTFEGMLAPTERDGKRSGRDLSDDVDVMADGGVPDPDTFDMPKRDTEAPEVRK